MLDLIIILLLLLFVFIGIKRGVVKTLLNLAGVILSVFLSTVLGSSIAEWIYDVFFKNGIINSIDNTLTQTGAAETVENAINSIPDLVFNAISFFGITKESLLSRTENAVTSAQSGISNSIEGVVSPILTSIISFFLIIILFILLLVLFKSLIRLIGVLFELPVLHMCNKVSGGVLGFIEGAAIVYLLVLLVKIVLPFTGDDFFITGQMINESIIFKAMYNLNIFNNITELSSRVSQLTLNN